jgi:hypothetical protein
MVIALPKNPFVRLLGAALVHVVLAALFVVDKLGFGNAVSYARERLNDEALFELKMPRLYIYSKVDEMVRWSDVYDHAEDARRKGYKRVSEVVFDHSGHCAHLREDEDKYWKAVEDCYGLDPELSPGSRLKL